MLFGLLSIIIDLYSHICRSKFAVPLNMRLDLKCNEKNVGFVVISANEEQQQMSE